MSVPARQTTTARRCSRDHRCAAAIAIALVSGLFGGAARGEDGDEKVALAGGGVMASTKAEVNRLLARSVELRAAREDAIAVALLERARELDPESARVQAHLATAHQATGNWARAEELLTGVLRRHADPYVVRYRDRLEAARLEGRSHLERPGRGDVSPSGERPAELAADDDAFTLRGPALSSPVRQSEGGSSASWLRWGLLGVAGASAVTTLGALTYREGHARRWNDRARCLEPGITRAELCGSERDAVRTGERVALVGGTLTGLFTLGAVLHAAVWPDERAPASVARFSCGLDAESIGVMCDGSF